ncbi:hypothetical protein GGI35DRAFT_456993 [Trichoderma velutinum]
MEHKPSMQDATARNGRLRSTRTTCSYLAVGCFSTIAFCMASSQATKQAVNAYSWKAYHDYIPVPLYSFMSDLDDFEVYTILIIAALWLCILCLIQIMGQTRWHERYALPIMVATVITMYLSRSFFIQGDTTKFLQCFLISIYAYAFIGLLVDIHTNLYSSEVVMGELLASDKC